LASLLMLSSRMRENVRGRGVFRSV
jgi:hypothetical protein